VIRVHVKNFQSIADAKIEIDGFTVVTGTNNTGKSALLRAMHGVFTNPPPASIVRYGADHCEVKIEFADGTTILWRKGPKINAYWLNGKQLGVSAGRGVPDEVLKVGYAPITVGGHSLWPQFAKQKKGDLFLLDLPGSAVADAVANVERIRVLNHALKACESERRTVNSDLKLRRKDGDKLDEALARFDGLDDAASKLDGLDEARAKAEKMVKLYKLLDATRERISKAEAEVEKLHGFDQVRAPADASVIDIESVKAERQDVARLKDRLGKLGQRVGQWTKAAEVAATATPGDDDAVVKGNKMRQGRKVLVRLQKLVTENIERITTLKSLRAEKREGLKTAEAEVHSILGDYEDCPTCGTALHEIPY
jgi:chromosome segregation ATPase